MGIGVYALVLVGGRALLNDSDTYWQIAVGQWILDHHALPRVDIYSFTKAGEPWISSSWLAQVLYATSYNLAGWTGPVVLAATCIAATFALLIISSAAAFPRPMRSSSRCGAGAVGGAFSGAAACAGAAGHGGVGERADVGERARQAPSFWLLPLMALWANLHGGFVFGLVLVGAFALDALWNADRSQRKTLALRWTAFGVAALAAGCVTPYGWESLLASRKISRSASSCI